MSWFGTRRAVPLPAGVALFSPWVDIVQSMPSWSTNQKWDYLPAPGRLEKVQPPPDDAWPATPPRKHLYVDDALRLHPLVSAQLARPGWAGAPPFWVACGWECLADDDKYLVARLRADGVRVAFEEYEAMPHAFPAVLPGNAASARCVQGCADFVTATRKDPLGIATRYTYIRAKTLEEREGDMETLTPYTEKDVFEMAYKMVGREPPVPLLSPDL